MLVRQHSKRLPICRRLAVTSVGLALLTTVTFAVGDNMALYVGGTLKQFTPPPISRTEAVAGALFGGVTPPPKTEGRINLASESEIQFNAGRRGILAIPYKAVTSLEYGLEPGRRVPKGRGLVLLIAWDPIEQYTKNAHNLLTIVFRDQEGTEQAVVLELGTKLVRPTLEMLERRTGQAVAFLNVEACMVFRNNFEACDYGQPSELKGLKKVFLDTSIPPARRKIILSEIETGDAGLELMESPEGSEIILSYQGQQSLDPNCPCESGRGEVSVVRVDRRRVVLVFTGTKRGVWGRNPTEQFGRAFLNAVRNANGLAPLRE